MTSLPTSLIALPSVARWLTGPIFGKELRVASRRRRGYVLRLAYVLSLSVFAVVVWIGAIELAGGGALSRAQMQVAAHRIVMGIVWFQFWAAQLVALVLMSTTISDEVYGRTLGGLLTTPLSATQVVLNKFSSRIVQLLVLVATTLPLLAIVRVLGGIPWSYLIVSLGVTAATVIFVGTVSLFFSALCRRAYFVVFAGALSVGFLFLLVPFLGLVLLDPPFSERQILRMSLYGNPYLLLYRYTDYALSPRGPAFVSVAQIVSCCAALLTAAALVLKWAVRLVESVALPRAMGDPSLLDRLRRSRWQGETPDQGPSRPPRDVGLVAGTTRVGKEAAGTLTPRRKLALQAIVALEILLILTANLFPALMPVVPRRVLHLLPMGIFLGLGVLMVLTGSLVLRWAARLVKSVALRWALGDLSLWDWLRRRHGRSETRDQEPNRGPRGIRRVVGAPMIWKETTCTLSDRQKFATRLIVGLEIFLILLVYLFPTLMSVVSYEALHLLLIWVFLALGVLLTLIASATVISAEREAGTWPLLLLTPLTDREILLGKFVGVLRRSGPVWLALLAYIAAFTYGRCFHPLALAQVTILVLTVLLFLSATGFYFSLRCRRTTDAVTANLVGAGVLWCAAPLLSAAVELRIKEVGACEFVSFLVVPFVQALALVATTLEGYAGGGLYWFGHHLEGPDVTIWMLVSMAGYLLLSLGFAWRAARLFRRHIV